MHKCTSEEKYLASSMATAFVINIKNGLSGEELVIKSWENFAKMLCYDTECQDLSEKKARRNRAIELFDGCLAMSVHSLLEEQYIK